MANGAPRAKFADVGQQRACIPSWLPGSKHKAARAGDSASLRPPKLPSEFLDAVRHELDHDLAVRVRASLPPELGVRHSDAPISSALGPTSSRGQPAEAAPAAPAPSAPEPPKLDPALIHAFEHAVLALGQERERVFAETAGQLAELAVLIARRVIGRELSLDPGLVRELVREGVQALGQHDRVLVRLGTGFASARELVETQLRDDGARSEVRLDPALDAYGCVVETELGQVDESIESRLETLLSALKPNQD